MCNCTTHVRDLSETHDGKYPPSRHAPSCEDFKTEPFTRIEFDGTACTMEPHEAEAFMADGSAEYAATTVHLTRDQFEALPEFAGF